MSAFDEGETAPSAPAIPCAICRADSNGEIWGYALCDQHTSDWFAKSPRETAIAETVDELDIAGRITRRFPEDPTKAECVSFKPGVYLRELTRWTAEWVKRERTLKLVPPP